MEKFKAGDQVICLNDEHLDKVGKVTGTASDEAGEFYLVTFEDGQGARCKEEELELHSGNAATAASASGAGDTSSVADGSDPDAA